VVALPLAMAFGIASGVTPQAGIYTAIVGGFLVSLLGGSRIQIGGPTGAFVVIVAGIIARHGLPGLLMVTMMAGVILLVLAVTGLGQAVKFIPRPVVLGFTNGIALLIASTQIKDFLGLGIGTPPSEFFARMTVLAQSIGTVNVVAFILATCSLALVLFVPRWLPKVPGAIVAHAWFHTENAEEIIAAQSQFLLVRGIRSKPVTSHRPGTGTPGAPGTMQDDKWLQGFALLQKYGLSWDLRVPYWHLVEAAEVARQFPRVPIVLNHTGFPWDRSEEGLAAWRRGMEAVARQPNVHVKVSEFGLKDSAWDYESNRRVVLEAIAIFGMERCIFASNFPVAGLRIDYDTLVSSLNGMLADFSQADRDRFFWKNAASFYRLSVG